MTNKNKKRKDYLKDYKIEYVEGKKSAVYQGKVYEIGAEAYKKARAQTKLIVITALLIGIYLACGAVATPAMNQMYVALPFVIIFLPMFFLILYELPLICAKTTLVEKEYSHLTAHSLNLSMLITALSVLSGSGALFFALSNAGSFEQLLYIAGCFIIAILCILNLGVLNNIKNYIRQIM